MGIEKKGVESKTEKIYFGIYDYIKEVVIVTTIVLSYYQINRNEIISNIENSTYPTIEMSCEEFKKHEKKIEIGNKIYYLDYIEINGKNIYYLKPIK